MTTSTSVFYRYWEGGNLFAVCAMVPASIAVLAFYPNIAHCVSRWNLDINVIYANLLTVYSLVFGSLLALFGILITRPTELLYRLRNTAAFTRIVANLKATLLFAVIGIAATFILSSLKYEPGIRLDAASTAFVLWCLLELCLAAFFARTIRIILLII